MKKGYRYAVMVGFLLFFIFLSSRHFILGGGEAASVDALCPFGGFESFYTWLATGRFVPRVMMSSMILAGIVLASTLVLRRGFCGYICPLGTVQEFIGKLWKKKITVPKKIDKYAVYIKYIVLVVILFGTYKMGELVFRGYDPFLALFHFGKGIIWNYTPSEFAEHLPALIILLFVLALAVVIERFWCRYLCPLGAVMGFFSFVGLTTIARDKKSCNSCKMCDKKCPAAINVSRQKVIKDTECIDCSICIDTCPKKSLSYSMLGKSFGSTAYLFMIVGVLVLGIIGAKASGIWASVPNIEDFQQLEPEEVAQEIKGWMTVADVAQAAGICVGHLMNDFGLPPGFDPMTPIKDISKKYGMDIHASDFREYIESFEHSPTPHLEHEGSEGSDGHDKSGHDDSGHDDNDDVLCPWGIRDDPAPGLCPFYVDNDPDGLCDYSQ